MTRKDTIIVAALVNAGLLIVLFVSALKTQDDGDKVASQKESSEWSSQEGVSLSDSKKVLGEEVDLALKQYNQQDPLQVQAVPVQTVAASSSFVDDLQGLTPVVAAAPIQAAAPIAKEEAAPAWIEVKVKKGDMLEKIARQHRTSVSEIMKVNGLSSTQLKIGQVLKISSSPAKESTPKPQATVLDNAPSKFYTVKTGDSPWTIAVKNHMKVEELLRLNNMTEEKARRLKPGDQIRIR